MGARRILTSTIAGSSLLRGLRVLIQDKLFANICQKAIEFYVLRQAANEKASPAMHWLPCPVVQNRQQVHYSVK